MLEAGVDSESYSPTISKLRNREPRGIQPSSQVYSATQNLHQSPYRIVVRGLWKIRIF